MNTIFGKGSMENIPVGIVDLDQTSTSRQITRTLAAVPTIQITKNYADPKESRKATLRKDIYAYVLIPKNFESDLLGGREATIPYYIHYALLSVGVELQGALETTFAQIALTPLVTAGASLGTTPKDIESFLLPVNFEAHPLYNPSLDYTIYLISPFFYVLYQIIILLVTMYTLGSEIKFKTAAEWLHTADMNIFTAVTAKLLPYTLIYIIMGIFANYIMFGIQQIPLQAGYLPVNLSTALFIIATQAFGVLIFSIFPAISIIMSIGSMIGSLGATLSGVTFPLFAMHPVIHYVSYLFPIKHFVQINQNILYGNFGFSYAWQNVNILLLFLLPALLILPHLKNSTLSGKYENIE